MARLSDSCTTKGARPSGGFAAPYLSYSAPFAYLVSEHMAVELRPSLTITFHQDSAPTDLHGWLSAAVLWRRARQGLRGEMG